MKFERQTNEIEQLAYPDELEKLLGVSEIVNKLEADFDLFVKEKEEEWEMRRENREDKINERLNEDDKEDPELRTLRLIKAFMAKKKDGINRITEESPLKGYDCLTMSIITCLLANRKGYQVKIGRPDKFSRFFHALIVRGSGSMFKIAGRSRNYEVKVMDTSDVSRRLKTTKPLVNIVNSVAQRFKK